MSWKSCYSGSDVALYGQPRYTSGLVQFTRAPSVFERSGQSRSLLGDSVRWLKCFQSEEAFADIRRLTSPWSEEDMESGRSCGDEGRYGEVGIG